MVLNRISLIETPLRGNSLSSICYWEATGNSGICLNTMKSSHGSSSLLPSETIWPLKPQLLSRMRMNTPENRPCCSPGAAQEKARYSLHNKMLYDPGCSQAIFRELSRGMSPTLSADKYCKYLEIWRRNNRLLPFHIAIFKWTHCDKLLLIVTHWLYFCPVLEKDNFVYNLRRK